MERIKIYTIDSKKMIKKGLPGWNPHQEQAKTYYPFIEKNDKCYKVQISDDNLINELFGFTSISEKERVLNNDDYGILISIRYIVDDKYGMTLYYHPKNTHVRHFNISNYVADESDYMLADKIVQWINQKVS